MTDRRRADTQGTSPPAGPGTPGSRPGRRSLRSLGKSPRQLGTNPRALGTNPRATRQLATSSPDDADAGVSTRRAARRTAAPAVDAPTAPPLEAGDQVAELAAGSGAQPRNRSLLPRDADRSHTTAHTSSDGRDRTVVVDGEPRTGQGNGDQLGDELAPAA